MLAISWPELQGSRATMLGTSLVVGAVLCYGLAVNLAVPLQQRHGALPVLLRAQLAALVLLAPFGLWGLRGSHFAWGPALAMLPLGILGTVLGFGCIIGGLVGIGGIAVGRRVKNDIDADPGRYTGRSQAIAGIITGIVGVSICILATLFIVLAIIAGISNANF